MATRTHHEILECALTEHTVRTDDLIAALQAAHQAITDHPKAAAKGPRDATYKVANEAFNAVGRLEEFVLADDNLPAQLRRSLSMAFGGMACWVLDYMDWRYAKSRLGGELDCDADDVNDAMVAAGIECPADEWTPKHGSWSDGDFGSTPTDPTADALKRAREELGLPEG